MLFIDNVVQNSVVDPNWIMAIIAFCAVISPIITAIINNIYQANNKRLEMYELAKREALSEYIKALYTASSCNSPENISNYFICLNNLRLYFSNLNELDYNDLTDIDKDIYYQDYKSHKTIELLAKQIKKK